jgi:hypothetical protein
VAVWLLKTSCKWLRARIPFADGISIAARFRGLQLEKNDCKFFKKFFNFQKQVKIVILLVISLLLQGM